MEKRHSVRLTVEAVQALTWLKNQLGGFNLSKAVCQMLISTAKSKGWIGLMLLALVGCGSGENTAPVPEATGVYRDKVGYLSISNKMLSDTDQSIQDDFSKAKQCVKAHYSGPIYEGPIRVVEFAGAFNCTGSGLVYGCADQPTGTIFVTFSNTNPHYVISHESVHLLTGIGNEGHGKTPFTECEMPI